MSEAGERAVLSLYAERVGFGLCFPNQSLFFLLPGATIVCLWAQLAYRVDTQHACRCSVDHPKHGRKDDAAVRLSPTSPVLSSIFDRPQQQSCLFFSPRSARRAWSGFGDDHPCSHAFRFSHHGRLLADTLEEHPFLSLTKHHNARKQQCHEKTGRKFRKLHGLHRSKEKRAHRKETGRENDFVSSASYPTACNLRGKSIDL